MASWDYRVMRKDGQVAIPLVIIEEDGSISGYTGEPVHPRAETPEDLVEDLDRYQRALAKPVLDFATFEAETAARRGTRSS
jgi:hypothetical protein